MRAKIHLGPHYILQGKGNNMKPIINKEVTKNKKSKLNTSLAAGLLFTSPVILGYIIFVLVPLLMTITFSFTDFSIGAQSTKFVGIQNYREMFQGKDIFFFPAVKATFKYVFLSVPLGIIFSILFAVLLNTKIRGRSFLRGLFYLPVVIPLASSSMIWMWMLEPNFGIVNKLLKAIGLPGSTWLSSDETLIFSLILVSLWLCGNNIVIFLAGLQNIPAQLYEAIEVDGGNFWQKFIYVTLPMLSPVIFFNTVLGFINGFQTFVQPYIMTSGSLQATMGGPNSSGLLITLYIYQNAFRYLKMGSASAAAVLLFIVLLILTGFIFKIGKSYVYYEGGGK